MTRRQADIHKLFNDDPSVTPNLRPVLTQEHARGLRADHPIRSGSEAARHLGRLERMLAFYRAKVDTMSPHEGQHVMFTGFIAALVYAISVIKAYRKLTKQIIEIAEKKT